MYLYVWDFNALLGVYVLFGLIVIEPKASQEGAPRMVKMWGELDSSKYVLVASINEGKYDPVRVGCYKLFEFIEF